MLHDLVFQVSPIELAGYTMLHFLWAGTIVWILAIILRRLVSGAKSGTRYTIAIFSLLMLVGTAFGCFVFTAGQLREAMIEQQQSSFVAYENLNPQLAPESASQMSPLPIITTAISNQTVREIPTPREAFFAWLQDVLLTSAVRSLPWIWLVGTIMVAVLYVTGVFGTVQLRRKSTPIEDEKVLKRLAQLQRSLGIVGNVALRACEEIASPIVVGILRPMILLPPSVLTGLTDDQLEMILLHELSHVKRFDNFVNLMQRVVEALFFYHPAIWWASRWIRLEREHCCDAIVLAHDHTPQSYAETLASLAIPELSPKFAVAAMANHQLTSRICHILNVEEKTMTNSRRTFGLAIVLVLVVLAAGYRAAFAIPSPLSQEQADESNADIEAAYEDDLLDAGASDLFFSNVLDDQKIARSLSSSPTEWSASQATGPPNVDEAADDQRAWASLTEDDQPEWLRLTWDEPVEAIAIMVVETFNPGALVKVTTGDSDPFSESIVLWKGKDPVSPDSQRGVAVIPLKGKRKLTNITLHLDSPGVPGRNEIDAVALVEFTTGQSLWADKAEASSSFAEARQAQLATSEILLRRLMIDLTGAPPTKEQLEAVRKRSTSESVIDKLVKERLTLQGHFHHGELERSLKALQKSCTDCHMVDNDHSQIHSLEKWITAPDSTSASQKALNFLWQNKMEDRKSIRDRELLDQIATDESPKLESLLNSFNQDVGEEQSKLEQLQKAINEQQKAIRQVTAMLKLIQRQLKAETSEDPFDDSETSDFADPFDSDGSEFDDFIDPLTGDSEGTLDEIKNSDADQRF